MLDAGPGRGWQCAVLPVFRIVANYFYCLGVGRAPAVIRNKYNNTYLVTSLAHFLSTQQYIGLLFSLEGMTVSYSSLHIGSY